MTKLTPLKLDDGTVIYMENQEEVEIDSDDSTLAESKTEVTRADLGKGGKGIKEDIVRNFQLVEGTIRAYTDYTLNAFKKVGNANIDKVTLEFGIKVGGKAGIPYVTEGSADSHLKITVECSFPDKERGADIKS